jgi:hypothetical protein
VVDDFRRGRVTMQELAIRGTPDSKYWGQEKHWISEDPGSRPRVGRVR